MMRRRSGGVRLHSGLRLQWVRVWVLAVPVAGVIALLLRRLGADALGGGTVASVGRALTEPVVVLVNARVACPLFSSLASWWGCIAGCGGAGKLASLDLKGAAVNPVGKAAITVRLLDLSGPSVEPRNGGSLKVR